MFLDNSYRKCLPLAMLVGALTACGGDGSSSSDNIIDDPETGSEIAMGNGVGANFARDEIGITDGDLQSGESTQLQISFVDVLNDNNVVTEPFTVVITSSCLASDRATIEGDLETTTGGLTLTYTATGCTGTDVLTASATASTGESIGATGTIEIASDEVLSVQFVEPEEPIQLSLRGIGGNETAQVKFKLVGQQSAPIVGESVSFELNTTAGGVSLAANEADSNNSGEVTAIVQSGTVHTTVVVTATHIASGISGSSDGIDISSGIPQADRFSLSRSIGNPRGLNYDGTEVEFNIISADHFGNPVPDGTVISFASPEGGTIPSSCSTVGGRCSVTWVSSEPRPDDGRATVIAYTTGAEAYIDVNGNSVFDDGDVFDTATMDLEEPYVDANENDMHDPGEFFFDINNNGSHDLADGLWNGPLCEHSTMCGNVDEVGISQTVTLAMSGDTVAIADLGTFDPSGTITLEVNESVSLNGLLLSDTNGNAPVFGTEAFFTTTLGTLTGTTSIEVADRTTPVQFPGMVLTAPANPGTGLLTLRVNVPDVAEQVLSWDIVVTAAP